METVEEWLGCLQGLVGPTAAERTFLLSSHLLNFYLKTGLFVERDAGTIGVEAVSTSCFCETDLAPAEAHVLIWLQR